jgi:glycosyltransferase involved in cell wall biosynthesis
LAALVTTANAIDGLALASRHALDSRAQVVPNAVPLPAVAMPPAPGRGRIVFVGNFRYAPNIEGAQWLVGEVSPLIERPFRIDLVGRNGRAVRALASDRVVVHGAVPDVWPFYRDADVAVAPLHTGSGTRTKVLEAFAHRRPLVSTTFGAEGIAAEDGRQLIFADSPGAFAAAIERAFDGDGSQAMTDAAYELVSREYEIGSTAQRFGQLLLETIARR